MTWNVHDLKSQAGVKTGGAHPDAGEPEPPMPDKVPIEALADELEIWIDAAGGREAADLPMWLRAEAEAFGLVTEREWGVARRRMFRGIVEL